VDRTTPWEHLLLQQQLNTTCNQLANCTVTRARSREGSKKMCARLLPWESVAIIADGTKITLDIAPSVRFQLGWEEAWKLYTKLVRIVNGANKGGLGWVANTFNLVDWCSIAAILKGKPEMFGLWLSKQSIGVCAMRKILVRIQDILDDHC
jgi:hypothetical protein